MTLILGVIIMLAVAVGLIVSDEGLKGGILVIIVSVGILLGVSSFIFPIFGFYFTIVYTFFLFDIQRLFLINFPLGTLIDLNIFVTFFGIAFQKYKNREPLLIRCNNPILIVYVIIILYSLIQFLNPLGAPLDHTLLLYRRFLSLMAFFYCAIQLFNKKRDITIYLVIILSLCCFAGLYSCYQEWFGYPKYQMRYILSDPVRERLMSLDNGNYRKFSFFASPTDFGIMMGAAALVGIVLMLNIKMKFKYRSILFIYTIVFVLAMAYSGTRTATFMLSMGLALYILMSIERKTTLIFSITFLLAFMFLMFGPIYGNATINRLRSTFELSTEKSLEVRDINRKRIQPFIHSHPLGGGLGTSSGNAVPGHPLSDFPADSGLLRSAIEYGWIGLLLQCFLYFIILQQGAMSFYRSNFNVYKTYYLASVVGIFGYVVAQYAQVAIGMVPGSFLFYGLLATIIRLRQMEIVNSNDLTS